MSSIEQSYPLKARLIGLVVCIVAMGLAVFAGTIPAAPGEVEGSKFPLWSVPAIISLIGFLIAILPELMILVRMVQNVRKGKDPEAQVAPETESPAPAIQQPPVQPSPVPVTPPPAVPAASLVPPPSPSTPIDLNGPITVLGSPPVQPPEAPK